MNSIRNLVSLLSESERTQAIWILAMVVVMAFLDMVGVASIVPFIAVLGEPGIVETNPAMSRVHGWLGHPKEREFLLVIGFAVFCTLMISIAFRALTTWVQVRYSLRTEYAMASRTLAAYLGQPYEWFLDRHSADIAKTVLSEVSQVVSNAIMPLLMIVANLSVILGILMLLLVADARLTLAVVVILGGGYTLIYMLSRGYLGRIGTRAVEANRARYKAVGEAFGGIKDVKINRLELAFLSKFELPARDYADFQAASKALSQLPRFLLEAIGFGGMLLVVLYLMGGGSDLTAVLPTMALYAFAAIRLMPAGQQIYSNLAVLRYADGAVKSLENTIRACAPGEGDPESNASNIDVEFRESIRLDSVTYYYPGASSPAIKDVQIEILRGSRVGIVGSTGSGKTTTVDLLLGLLKPSIGELKVDGRPVSRDSRQSYQRMIGYVPQSIYLVDESLSANIAFGVAEDLIDPSLVRLAAKRAQISSFIESELAEGYQTSVGERGVRLSGGQLQRVGIARALYRLPKVLVLDEATSALDSHTEAAVLSAIADLGITVISIAHRLSTVRDCSIIYFLANGRVTGRGTYDQLVGSHAGFRLLADVQDQNN